MGKYTEEKIEGCYLYFTSKCTAEAFHAHGNVNTMRREGSAKFFIREDGSVKVDDVGCLNKRQIKAIVEYIGINYLEMVDKWKKGSLSGVPFRYYEK